MKATVAKPRAKAASKKKPAKETATEATDRAADALSAPEAAVKANKAGSKRDTPESGGVEQNDDDDFVSTVKKTKR